MGRPICPVSSTIERDRQYEQTVEGRVISLTEIRMQHLEKMFNMGILRMTKTESLSAGECKEVLARFKGNYKTCQYIAAFDTIDNNKISYQLLNHHKSRNGCLEAPTSTLYYSQ